MHLRYIAVENILRKGEIACFKQYLLFSQCFLPNMALIFHFNCTLESCLQFVSVWTHVKFCHLVKSFVNLSDDLLGIYRIYHELVVEMKLYESWKILLSESLASLITFFNTSLM